MKSMNFIKRAMVTAMAVLCFSIAANADNKLYFKDFSIAPGVETEVPMYMDYDNPDLGGFQCNVYLPEGLNVATFNTGTPKVTFYPERDYTQENDGFTLFCGKTLHEGYFSIITGNIATGEDYPIKGNSGERMLKVIFKADNNFKGGVIQVKDTRISDTKGSAGSTIGEETTANVSVETETGVEETLVESADAEYYTIDGIKVAKANLTQGIYIKKVGNKATKVLVK